jgi:hypothetical protein
MWILVIVALGAAVMGLIPASIADRKGRSFGAWWLYGFAFYVIAVIHVLLAEDLTRRPCPWCAESIRPEARICPHCGRDVEAAVVPANSADSFEVQQLRVALEVLADTGGDVARATALHPDLELTRWIGELAERALVDLESWEHVTITQAGHEWLATDEFSPPARLPRSGN